MVYDYYPGCTIKNINSVYDKELRAVSEALGITLKELEDWQCCGGVYPICANETAQKLPSVRALHSALDNSGCLTTACSACYHVLKSVNYDMKNNPAIRNKANLYEEFEKPYMGETKVMHYLEILRDHIGFDNLKENVKTPLNKKIAAYYGCLLLRPSKIMAFDNAENPRIIEDFINALGGEAVVYPFRNECCGGYISAEDESITEKRCKMIIDSAISHGASEIVTACPLCLFNLKKYSPIPVKFFTELLCEALDCKLEATV